MADQFSHDELSRYARHFVLPEFGRAAQEKLRVSSVLVVGAGGLGSPALLYLAAAGVGTLGIADHDSVDISNLQRQVIHDTKRVGEPKVASAKRAVEALNPHVSVRTHAERLTSENALAVLGSYDIIIDGTDNFPTRYLLNDAAVLLGKPLVYGSVFRFEGQASVLNLRHGPCYRCLYPEPPPPELSPGCAEAGVLGVLPGLIGTIQATEAIKVLTGIGEPLSGRLLLIETLSMEFHMLTVGRDPDCPVCSQHPTITSLIDYEAFCNPQRTHQEDTMIPEITVTELKKRMDAKEALTLLDVRQGDEHRFVNIGGKLIPLHELPERMGELNPAEETIIYCRSGSRSATAVRFLQKEGFSNVKNLRGGILAWATEVDTTLPKY